MLFKWVNILKLNKFFKKYFVKQILTLTGTRTGYALDTSFKILFFNPKKFKTKNKSWQKYIQGYAQMICD